MRTTSVLQKNTHCIQPSISSHCIVIKLSLLFLLFAVTPVEVTADATAEVRHAELPNSYQKLCAYCYSIAVTAAPALTTATST
eukprot:15076-Heterococcus_DN1.PRE.4